MNGQYVDIQKLISKILFIFTVTATAILSVFVSNVAADVPATFIPQADTIIACQHSSGAIAMTPQFYPSDSAASPIWINPYFANYAGIALLSAYQKTGNAVYLTAVRQYIEWYAINLNPDGTIDDCTGSWSAYAKTGTYDASDAYAATFLVLVNRYHSIVGNLAWLSTLADSIVKVSGAIDITYDSSDGLAKGKPTYPVKFLMDNAEVRLGYLAGRNLAVALNRSDTNFSSSFFSTRLDSVVTGLRGYWTADSSTFRWAKFENGTYTTYSPTTWYAPGMANAMHLSYTLCPRDSNAATLLGKIYNDFYVPGVPPDDLREYFFLATALKKFNRAVEGNGVIEGLYGDLYRASTYVHHHAFYVLYYAYDENADLFEYELTGVFCNINCSLTETALPVSSKVNEDTDATIVMPSATGETYIQLNLSGGGTNGPVTTRINTSGSGADYIVTTSLLESNDTLVIKIWSNQSSMRLFAGLRTDSNSIPSGCLPSGISANDTGRRALGTTGILLEFADSNGILAGDSISTTFIGDTFAFMLVYNLSETTTRLFSELGFDTGAGSSSFRFWYADTYRGVWKYDSTVTVVVETGAQGGIRVNVVGITKDLPGGLGGISPNTALDGGGGICILRNFFLPAFLHGTFRGVRDFLFRTSIGRAVVYLYYGGAK